METIYLNMKTYPGVETVDEFTREVGQSPVSFRQYVNSMVKEYRIAGMDVYKSSRCTNDWKSK
jgi:hypothetical protein